MIIANLLGGLGNQMFQAACGRALSLRTGQPLKLAVDQFETYGLHHGYQIAKVFSWQPELASAADLREVIGWQSHPFVRKVLGRPAMRAWSNRGWANEPHLHFWPALASVHGPRYLHGYWQSERYFADFAAQVRADFTFTLEPDAADRAILEQMQAAPSVSLHVRRGDYLHAKNAGLYAPIGIEFYRLALAHIRQRVPGLRCFAFSDDPAWVMEHLAPLAQPLVVVSHNAGARGPRDMQLMAAAAHHIVANSTFSWWGAWLNPSPRKIVVAPRQWFADEVSRSSKDLIPSDWVRL